MMKIRAMESVDSYDVMDLWMRTTTKSNPFIEPDFWKKNYDHIKNKYISGQDTFVYEIDNDIVGFICVSEQNYIDGLFVEPEHQKIGIGSKLIDFAQSRFSMLHVHVYAKNRDALRFATNKGFLIDGAQMDNETGEVEYEMIWSE